MIEALQSEPGRMSRGAAADLRILQRRAYRISSRLIFAGVADESIEVHGSVKSEDPSTAGRAPTGADTRGYHDRNFKSSALADFAGYRYFWLIHHRVRFFSSFARLAVACRKQSLPSKSAAVPPSG